MSWNGSSWFLLAAISCQSTFAVTEPNTMATLLKPLKQRKHNSIGCQILARWNGGPICVGGECSDLLSPYSRGSGRAFTRW